jgi:hypothetical protein
MDRIWMRAVRTRDGLGLGPGFFLSSVMGKALASGAIPGFDPTIGRRLNYMLSSLHDKSMNMGRPREFCGKSQYFDNNPLEFYDAIAMI